MVTTYCDAVQSTHSLPSESLSFGALAAQVWHLKGRIGRVDREAEGIDAKELDSLRTLINRLEVQVEMNRSAFVGTRPKTGVGAGQPGRSKGQPSVRQKPDLSSTLKSIVTDFFNKDPHGKKSVTLPPEKNYSPTDNSSSECPTPEESDGEDEELKDLMRKISTMWEETQKSKNNHNDRNRSHAN